MDWRTSSLKSALALACSALLLGGALPAMAAPEALWVSVDDETLSTLRGGFINSEGFQISFQLENVISIDGVLQVQNRVEVPWGSGRPGFHSIFQESGDSGGVNLSVASNGLATLIQNTMDDKSIQHLRVINVEMRNLGGIAGIGVIHRIQPALISALR